MTFNPVSLSNLSAVVYMTCAGLLVPLERLCMFGLECDFRIPVCTDISLIYGSCTNVVYTYVYNVYIGMYSGLI